jgi:RNA polymerase sigma factor (sigma-70 family)
MSTTSAIQKNTEKPAISAKSGDSLDSLYDAFMTATVIAENYHSPENSLRLEDAKDALFRDASNYVERVLCKQSNAHAWTFTTQLNQRATGNESTDVAQIVCLRIWRQMPSFKHHSKFSTWVYAITRNAIMDAVRNRARLNECEIFEWRDNGGEYAGSVGTTTGAAPGSDHLKDNREGSADDDAASAGCSKRPLAAKAHRGAVELDRIVNMDIRTFLGTLSPGEQLLLLWKDRDGKSASEIAAFFHKNIRWVNNKYAKIKRLAKVWQHRSKDVR